MAELGGADFLFWWGGGEEGADGPGGFGEEGCDVEGGFCWVAGGAVGSRVGDGGSLFRAKSLEKRCTTAQTYRSRHD